MTNTIKFIQECFKNRQGLTIDVVGNMPEHKGYVISVPKYGKIFDLNKDTPDIVQLYKDYQNHFESFMYWFGFWFDSGKLYVDYNMILQDLPLALKLGKDFNQLAIFDLTNQKEIFIEY